MRGTWAVSGAGIGIALAAAPVAAQTTGGQFAVEVGQTQVLYSDLVASRPHLMTVCAATGQVTVLLGGPPDWKGIASLKPGQCRSIFVPLQNGQMLAVQGNAAKSTGTYALTLM